MSVQEVKKHLKALGDPQFAAQSRRFFKTGPGDYAQGDRFLGIRVPILRKQLRKYSNLPISDIEVLLCSSWHEIRMFALLLWVERFKKSDEVAREQIYQSYLQSTRFINNWDLVDTSAPDIVGAYLYRRDKKVLYQLAASEQLWEKRIAIVASFYFIKQGEYDETLRLSEILLSDSHDLIHKAVGWMLREVGKRDEAVEKAFLQPHYKLMPRTMLRYAIERFPEKERQAYLKGRV